MQNNLKTAVVAFWVIVFSFGILNAENIKPVTGFSDYLDESNCKQPIERNYYSVCWNETIGMPISGWTKIDGLLIDELNIKKRPSFFKDKEIKTISSKQIMMPNHLGHTFANDSDNDWSPESLKSTYNMINITAMNGQVNTGIWRQIENRGKAIAKFQGSVIAITLVEYHQEKKFGIVYPMNYYRIYLYNDVSVGEFPDECYMVENRPYKVGSLKLADVKVDCKQLKIEKGGK
jgi:endonuclease G